MTLETDNSGNMDNSTVSQHFICELIFGACLICLSAVQHYKKLYFPILSFLHSHRPKRNPIFILSAAHYVKTITVPEKENSHFLAVVSVKQHLEKDECLLLHS